MRLHQAIGCALGALFPSRCLLCNATPDGALDLCRHCRAALPWIMRPCERCGLPLADAPVPLCGACLTDPVPFARAIAPFAFAEPAADLIRAVKYGGDLAAARLLGNLLAEAIAARYRGPLPAVLIPTPLHWRRLIRRGHNQAALLARVTARALGMPIAFDAVRRTRPTPPQTGLDRRERKRNLRGAFTPRSALPRTVAVLDDVLTTGATLTELTRALHAGGAEHVHVWVLARTLN